MATSRLSQEFECPVCLMEMDNPKMMGQCLHSACLKCVGQLANASTDRYGFLCPICLGDCLIPVGGVSNLKDDFKLRSILEQYKLETEEREARRISTECTACRQPATDFCEDCGSIYLCTRCKEKHGQGTVTKKHVLSSLSHVCKDHGKALSYFCKECGVDLCSICSFSRHQDHAVFLISDITLDVISRLPAVLNKLSDVSTKLERTKECYSSELKKSLQEKERVELFITNGKYVKRETEAVAEIGDLTDRIISLERELNPLRVKKAAVEAALEGIRKEKKDRADGIKKKYTEIRVRVQGVLRDTEEEIVIVSRDLQLGDNILKEKVIDRKHLASVLGLVKGGGRYGAIMTKFRNVFSWLEKNFDD